MKEFTVLMMGHAPVKIKADTVDLGGADGHHLVFKRLLATPIPGDTSYIPTETVGLFSSWQAYFETPQKSEGANA